MIGQFEKRLKALVTDGSIKELNVTADADEAIEMGMQSHNLPCAFLHPVAHSASDVDDRPSAINQRIHHKIGVLLAVSDGVYQDGGEVLFDQQFAPIKNSLFGWQPQNAFGAVSYGGGHLVAAKEGILWFSTIWIVEENWTSV